MSAEYEAAQEICAVLQEIDKNLDRIYDAMPGQRERIATAALQGFLSMYGYDGISAPKLTFAAEQSVAYADALLAELHKEPPT